MRIPAQLVKAEAILDVRPDLKLYASHDPEIDWVMAQRCESVPSRYCINIDASVILDFDALGYLSVVEVFGTMSNFPLSAISLPSSYSRAAIQLAEPSVAAGFPEFESKVRSCKSGDGKLVQVIVVPEVTGLGDWLALGENVYVALDDGRPASFIFQL